MKLVRFLAIAAFVVAVTSILVALTSTLGPLRALVVVLPVALVAAALRMGRRHWLNYAFLLFGLQVLVASYYEANSALLLTAIIALIAAWDLEDYHTRASIFQRHDNEARLVSKHLSSLGIIAGLSVVLFALATNITLQINIYTAILLGLLLVLSLSQALRYLRNGDH